MFNKLSLILLIIFLPFLSSACKDHTSHPPKSYGDTLVIAESYRSGIIDPILASSGSSAYLIPLMFDGLVRMNEKMEAQPHLASSWEISPDGLRYIFHLRKGVRFHDGGELTSKDVKFTFDKIMEVKGKSPYWNSFRLVENVMIKDRYTVEVSLAKPNTSFPFAVDVGIMSEHIFHTRTIGTGPFKLVSSSPEKIILEANDDYFLGRPYLNKIIIKIFENQQIAWAKLLRGDVDFIHEVPLEQCRLTTKMSSFKIYSFLDTYYYILAFNLNDDLFEDRRVRQALNYTIDKEKIITTVLNGKGRAASGTIYPQSWAHNLELEPYSYNSKEALRLLKEAGWDDTDNDYILDKHGKPFQFTLYILEGDRLAERCALLIQEQLLDVGIRMKAETLALAVANEEYLLQKRFEAVFLNVIADDPDKNYQFWHSSQVEEGFNVFSYRNSKVDEFLDKGRETLDPEERKRIYYQFQKEIFRDPPGIFLFWRHNFVAMDGRFKGVKISPTGILSNIHEWYVPKEEQKY